MSRSVGYFSSNFLKDIINMTILGSIHDYSRITVNINPFYPLHFRKLY